MRESDARSIFNPSHSLESAVTASASASRIASARRLPSLVTASALYGPRPSKKSTYRFNSGCLSMNSLCVTNQLSIPHHKDAGHRPPLELAHLLQLRSRRRAHFLVQGIAVRVHGDDGDKILRLEDPHGFRDAQF